MPQYALYSMQHGAHTMSLVVSVGSMVTAILAGKFATEFVRAAVNFWTALRDRDFEAEFPHAASLGGGDLGKSLEGSGTSGGHLGDDDSADTAHDCGASSSTGARVDGCDFDFGEGKLLNLSVSVRVKKRGRYLHRH